ncbi:MAG TPA: dethiobiotin synthase [Streptosporangiaceae bacterium]|jgi:dethiobiotin synthetase|nr:dethiobiotin synthase [Streptosporangiaceae bacterium]
MSVLIVTGTGTGVGKTVVTAALAALARARGDEVAVVKPGQTGLASGAAGGDLDEVGRLAGVTDLHELARFPDPLSPEAAARAAGRPPLDLRDAADYVGKLAPARDLVLVEGAGGLLVRYDPAGTTLADLAAWLAAPVLVVTEPGLGTLNQTALTLEAMAARGLTLAGVVIGCWPERPGLAERSNVADLQTIIGAPLAGALPAGCPRAGPGGFLAAAGAGLAPAFGGRFDPALFGTAQAHLPDPGKADT